MSTSHWKPEQKSTTPMRGPGQNWWASNVADQHQLDQMHGAPWPSMRVRKLNDWIFEGACVTRFIHTLSYIHTWMLLKLLHGRRQEDKKTMCQHFGRILLVIFLGVAIWGVLEMRVPPKQPFKGIFPYKPSICGYCHLWASGPNSSKMTLCLAKEPDEQAGRVI